MKTKQELIELGKITQQKILSYLAEFKYSTPKTLEKALNINYKTLTGALKRYEKQELITVIEIQAPKTKVVGISWQGLAELGIIDQTKIFHESRFNERTLIHWLQCQNYAILSRNKGLKCYPAPAQKFASKGRGKTDLIEERDSFSIGIEIERTAKTLNRYAEVWGGHVQAIQNKEIDGVKYVLTTKRAEVVEKIFNKAKFVLTKDKRKIDFEPFKNRFKFIINHDL
ncbi:winged helix-turn-helix transcriptional regulator [Francisella frigiditurris]|uniref:Uncharacterized protein n=1 Tax=Francisella frigiditurris TaxID=1542390 RepID=A0A1J0KWG2_9GAMM|nr:winged helix-turn-helix transcriptional regulator [Francisella frigiditurris]APC98003.1 hypothetical protein KX01_1864 [Francisella frigiditurris]